MKVGPRQAIHAHEEIEALLTGRKLTTIVFFLDEMFKEITYNMASTVADAIKEVAGIVKLSAPSSLYLKAEKLSLVLNHLTLAMRSFSLTEEEYLLRLVDVANTLKC